MLTLDQALLRRYPELHWARYDHLPPHLADISRPFAELAWRMARQLPSGPAERIQVQRMLHRLEEAKDCAVRAQVGVPQHRDQEKENTSELRGD